jgi:hypothetical protein
MHIKTLGLVLVLTGCAATAPVKIGAETYYASKQNTGGIFGNVDSIAGELMAQGNAHCEALGKQFELVTQKTENAIPAVRLGGASITFKCTDKPKDPVMRPDKGVSTIEIR